MPFDNVNKQIGWLVEDTNAGLKAAAEKAGSTSPRSSPRRGEGAEPVKFKAAVWKKNALRHSFISYRVADTQNVNQTALECGNSPSIIFKHYRELVRPAEATKWFGIAPDADGKTMVIPKADEAAVAVA